ncbi:MAG: hypothetical protein PHE56_09210 [Bacteroidales bacterium]|nr:hypothetical protein [Bacteroidales bacterium]
MKRIIIRIKNLERNKKLIILAILLLISNLILMFFVNIGDGKNLAGQIKSSTEVRNAGLRTLFFGLPLFSIILGSIISIFLPKKKTYNQRFINSGLIILIGFYLIMLILEIRNMILW